MKLFNKLMKTSLLASSLLFCSHHALAESPNFELTPELIQWLTENPELWPMLGQNINVGAGNNTPDLTLLSLYWSRDKHDNHTVFNANPPAKSVSEQNAERQGYRYIRSEACPIKENLPGTLPIRLYYHSGRADYASVVAKDAYVVLENGGYKFVETQGFVYTNEQPGTIPLQQYYSDKHQDAFLTAKAESIQSAQQAGYRLLRTEGWVFPDVAGGCVLY